MKALLGIMLLLFASFATHAADFMQVSQWQKAGDHQQSFPALRQLAELGYAPAQVELARSFANGYGSKIDFLQAYAWALMAKAQNHPLADPLYLQLRGKISSRRAGKNLYQQLQSQFGTAALNTSLYPQLHVKALPMGAMPEALSTPQPEFPAEVYESQNALWALVQFDINEAGLTENVTILASHPAHQYNRLITDTVATWQFKPNSDALNNPLRFDLQTRLFTLYPQQSNFARSPQFKQINQAANAGNAAAQYLLARLLQHSVVEENEGTPLHWLIQAAINGNTQAQYQLYLCSAYQSHCKQQPEKAERWLQMAANGNEPRAKFPLLRNRLQGSPKQQLAAVKDLQQLIQTHNLPALILYANLLANSKNPTIKNSETAIKIANQAMALDQNNPHLLATLAIAHYDLELHDKSQSLLMGAIKEAEFRHWPIDYYVNLLEQYQRATLLP